MGCSKSKEATDSGEIHRFTCAEENRLHSGGLNGGKATSPVYAMWDRQGKGRRLCGSGCARQPRHLHHAGRARGEPPQGTGDGDPGA